MQAQFMRV